MKRILVVLAATAALVGCGEPGAKPIPFSVLPPELADCTFHHIIGDQGHSLKVVRCPNSTTSTTYSQGKTTATTVVIDGVEYHRKTP
jgi:hypothetical protein